MSAQPMKISRAVASEFLPGLVNRGVRSYLTLSKTSYSCPNIWLTADT